LALAALPLPLSVAVVRWHETERCSGFCRNNLSVAGKYLPEELPRIGLWIEGYTGRWERSQLRGVKRQRVAYKGSRASLGI
jgi:hypothetical protein